MAKGSNLFDKFGEQLKLEKQVVNLGYEDPQELAERKQRENDMRKQAEKAADDLLSEHLYNAKK